MDILAGLNLNKREISVFEECVLNRLSFVYTGDSEIYNRRLSEIVSLAKEVKDLERYFSIACLAEGEERDLTYEERLQIVGGKTLRVGDHIYHFSNRQHNVGFMGHDNMFFTSEDDSFDVESDSLKKRFTNLFTYL